MSTKIMTIFAATAMALSLGFVAAPAASASTMSPPAAAAVPTQGSIALCFPLGSVVWCI